MKSLYVKFILLVIGFVLASMTLQWIIWRIRSVPVSRTKKDDGCLGTDCGLAPTTRSQAVTKKIEKELALKRPIVEEFHVPKINAIQTSPPKKKNDGVISVPKLNITSRRSISIKSKSGFEVAMPREVGIWNTGSNSDRILEQMVYVPKSSPSSARKPKIILAEGSAGNWGVKTGSATFKDHKCLVQNCEIINTQQKDGKIDALLLGQLLPDLTQYVERYRHPDVVWLWFGLESPMSTPTYAYMEHYINWTASYRRDSTIVAPYEKWVPHENPSASKLPARNYAKGKTKMAAIFVSNCASRNDRLYYVYDLQRNISVDIYGFCGKLKCDRSESSKCFDMLTKDYKFYLAFENSNCKDYITEKFFVNGLQNDVIPVVMGARKEEYEKVAPPHSFIHVDDFDSPADLATYLHKLDQNDTLYNEYFKWKGTGGFLNTKFWCRLCSLLNEDNKPELSVNLEKWWRPEDICTQNRWTKQ